MNGSSEAEAGGGMAGPQGATKHKGLNSQSFRTEDQAETFAHQSPWLKEWLANHSTDYHKYRSKEKPFYQDMRLQI